MVGMMRIDRKNGDTAGGCHLRVETYLQRGPDS